MTKALDLNHFARELGWSVAGACSTEIPIETQNLYQKWLRVFNASSMTYLEKRKEEKMSPRKYFPPAQSILCFGLYYFRGWAQGEVKISNYAWGPDYHSVLREKLKETVDALQRTLGTFEYRIVVDTSPLLEKTLAVKAGLGWQGKNSLLINRHQGSFLFLGEILTSLPTTVFTASVLETDHCGTCTRCIDACPTQALTPYVLNAKKCISYWTLEHKGDFTEETPSYKSWIAGCDICQEVCPWNAKLIPLGATPAQAYFQDLRPESIQNPQFLEKVSETALNYVNKKDWERNLKHIKT